MSKKKQVSLPDYTLGEEITNAVTHGIGAALSVAAVVLCVVRAASVRDPWMVVSGAIYGAMMIIMYTFSTVYHALAPNKGKRVMRVLDHCGVFLAVALVLCTNFGKTCWEALGSTKTGQLLRYAFLLLTLGLSVLHLTGSGMQAFIYAQF